MPDEAFDLLTGMSAQSIIAVSCVKCKEFSYFFIFSLGLDVAVVCIKLFQSYVVKLLHCVKLLFLKGFLSFFLSYSGWHMLPLHTSAEACLTGWPNAPGKGLV